MPIKFYTSERSTMIFSPTKNTMACTHIPTGNKVTNTFLSTFSIFIRGSSRTMSEF